MKKSLHQLKIQIDSLTVFANIKEDDAIKKLCALLEAVSGKPGDDTVRLYSDFVAALYPNSVSLTEYVRTLMLQDDNFYVKGRAAGRPAEPEVMDAVESELSILQKLADLRAGDMKAALGYDDYLPSWKNHSVDLKYDFMDDPVTFSLSETTHSCHTH